LLHKNDVAILPNTLEMTCEDDMLDAQRNMDMDATLGAQVASGQRLPLIRLWRSGARFGIGVSRKDVQSAGGKAALAALQQFGIDVVVRQTGGTAVPQGTGVLHVSMIFPRLAQASTTDAYYRILCDPLLAWLAHLGLQGETGELPGSYCDGSYNILVNGRKLVGTAQAWRGGLAGMASRQPGYVLAHACLVVDIDLAQAVQVMNTFYRIAEDPYEVNLETATTLADCLQATGRQRLSVQEVRASLQAFYSQYYTALGCTVESQRESEDEGISLY